MSIEERPEPAGEDGLQFDHAEYPAEAPAAVSCRACGRPLDDVYFEISQSVVCDGCRAMLADQFSRKPGFFGFARASLFGFGAAVAGAVITYLVMVIAHISAGIVSILVGYMVGKAVRSGAGHRGGLPYQFLAVFLTYSAAAWSFLPMRFEANGLDQVWARGAGVQAGAPQPRPGGALPKAAGGGGGAEAPAPKARSRVGPIVFWTLVAVLLLAECYALPFYMLAHASLTPLIILFGMHRAWQMTRKVALTVNGPYRVGDGGGLALTRAPAHE